MKKAVLALAVTAVLGAGNAAQANPVGDFFKRLGRSISKPRQHESVRRSTVQKSGTKPVGEKDSAGDQKQSEENKVEKADPVAPKQFTPSVRAASSAPDAKGKKRDTPFGIPVPGKKGFVTSPFSPDGNYVDVHAFAPGTEVKDPYTGKIFRVP
jgi:hypothetical protein